MIIIINIMLLLSSSLHNQLVCIHTGIKLKSLPKYQSQASTKYLTQTVNILRILKVWYLQVIGNGSLHCTTYLDARILFALEVLLTPQVNLCLCISMFAFKNQ